MKFEISIDMGNCEMHSYDNLIVALRKFVIKDLKSKSEYFEFPSSGVNGTILDLNGNRVGYWRIE